MKGIMLNEHYGLESATLKGLKTRTSRIVNFPKTRCGKDVCGLQPTHENKFTKVDIELLDADGISIEPNSFIVPRYILNEVVAIRQSYDNIFDEMESGRYNYDQYEDYRQLAMGMKLAGNKNKMFVRNDLMPHHIKITDIDVQNLQDISDDDCIKEGIKIGINPDGKHYYYFDTENVRTFFDTPRKTFAALIDKVSGKGTWYSNPLVWVYYYELVD